MEGCTDGQTDVSVEIVISIRQMFLCFSSDVVTFLKLGVLQRSRAHFAIKTGCALLGLYPYLIQKLGVPGHTRHLR